MAKTEFERKKERHASGESTMSADSISGYIPTPPDGGYGWMIVFCAFVIHIIVDGIAFTFGVFYVEFLNYFNESKAKTALVGSLLAGFYLLIAPFASALVNKFGSRSVCIAGGMLASLALLLSTMAPNIDFLMVTYGVLGGSGLGLAYLPCIVSVSFYFQKRRALATGIAVCGAGVGCFIFAPAGRMLLDHFDWKNAMLIISGAVLNLCVAGAMLRPLEPPRKPTKPRAKNMLDRLMEQAKRGVGRQRADSECSTCAYQVKDKVQEVKLAREQALRDEDSESEFGSIPNSAVNSVRRLDGRNSIIMNRIDSMTFKDRPVDIPTITFSPEKNEYPSDMNNTTDTDDGKVVIILTNESDSDTGKPRVPIYKPAIKSLNRVKMSNGVNSSLPNGMSVCPEHQNGGHLLAPSDFAERMQSQSVSLLPAKPKRRRKCPPGVHREDYSRPMYRKDIFYSGSVLHIPEFQSQPNVQGYMKSVTSIPPTMATMEDDQGMNACGCVPKSVKDTLKEMMDISLLKDPLFLVPCLGNFFGAIGLFIPYIYITQKALALGIQDSEAAFLLSVIGITNTVGRVLAGIMADIPWINTLALHNAALIVGGVSCILNMFCTTYYTLCIFAAVFGMCVATWISLTSIILCDLLGLQNLTNAFGLLTMTRGFASIAGPPIAGIVYDLTLDYNSSFHIGGLMLTLAGFLCCILHLPYFQRRCTSQLEKVAMELDIPLPEDSDEDDGNEADVEDDALAPV